MKYNLMVASLFVLYQVSHAQADLACPTDKIHREQDIVDFCDSLREKQANEMIYARVRISGDTSDPLGYKKKSIFILTKYEFFRFFPYEKIRPADSTYMWLSGGVIMSKATALDLIQDEYVVYITLESVPHIPEGPPHWPTSIRKRRLGESAPDPERNREFDLIGRTIRGQQRRATEHPIRISKP